MNLTAPDIAKLIKEAYLAKAVRVKAPTYDILRTVRKVRDVFASEPCREALIETVCAMMQPSNEELYIKPVIDLLAKGKQTIQVNLKHGMGLEIDAETQQDILQALDSRELRPKDFCRLMAKEFTNVARLYK